VLTHKLSTNSRIFYKGLGSHNEKLGGAQEAVEKLFKWLGTSNPQERGWDDFDRNLEN
jgi:hypothetical protein